MLLTFSFIIQIDLMKPPIELVILVLEVQLL
jgi:hypothetical protein